MTSLSIPSVSVSRAVSEPFCDWLDVTFHPDNDPISDLSAWLLSLGFFCDSSRQTDKGNSSVWISPDLSGVLKLDSAKQYSRVSASGGITRYFRDLGLFLEFCSFLASVPHRVSRLDAALDFVADGADVISDFQRALDGRDTFPLYRNSVSVKYFLGTRPSDGRVTGTVYFGYRSRSRITARVYDKQFEALERRGEVIPSLVRFEATRREGATLRDACSPVSLFWDVFGSIIEPPPDIPEWVSADMSPKFPPRPDVLPYQVLRRGVEMDAHLKRLIEVADAMPNGRLVLLQLLSSQILGSAAPVCGGAVQPELRLQ